MRTVFRMRSILRPTLLLVALLGGLAGCSTSTTPTTTTLEAERASTSIAAGQSVTAVFTGGFNSCAILEDTTVKCWGSNITGELGNGTETESSLTPVAVTGVSGATSVAIGNQHSCALLEDTTVKCWGYNGIGVLGDGTQDESPTPVLVAGMSGVKAIALGAFHSCALLEDETVKCWGMNDRGQLGDGTKEDRTTPVAVAGLSGVKAIAAGSSHSCAILEDITVKCWGGVSYSIGGAEEDSPTPLAVDGLSGVKGIAAGGNHSCAILEDTTVKCWGSNITGELGNGTQDDSTTPVAVTGLSGATHIALGTQHSCALLEDKTVKCWGYNGNGQLGASTDPRGASSTLVAVSALYGVRSISASAGHSCALLEDSTVKCWGMNRMGQLGNGTKEDSATPVLVVGLF